MPVPAPTKTPRPKRAKRRVGFATFAFSRSIGPTCTITLPHCDMMHIEKA
jgi:hypothetical protein